MLQFLILTDTLRARKLAFWLSLTGWTAWFLQGVTLNKLHFILLGSRIHGVAFMEVLLSTKVNFFLPFKIHDEISVPLSPCCNWIVNSVWFPHSWSSVFLHSRAFYSLECYSVDPCLTCPVSSCNYFYVSIHCSMQFFLQW